MFIIADNTSSPNLSLTTTTAMAPSTTTPATTSHHLHHHHQPLPHHLHFHQPLGITGFLSTTAQSR
ncbi:hypothetical protein Hanom_Chr09g00852751 [Helianthus anomalus]